MDKIIESLVIWKGFDDLKQKKPHLEISLVYFLRWGFVDKTYKVSY